MGPESPAAENQWIKEPSVHLLEQLVGLTVENVGWKATGRSLWPSVRQAGWWGVWWRDGKVIVLAPLWSDVDVSQCESSPLRMTPEWRGIGETHRGGRSAPLDQEETSCSLLSESEGSGAPSTWRPPDWLLSAAGVPALGDPKTCSPGGGRGQRSTIMFALLFKCVKYCLLWFSNR